MAIAVLRMQRNFGSLKQQVEEWQALPLSTAVAKLLIYRRSSRTKLDFRTEGGSFASSRPFHLCALLQSFVRVSLQANTVPGSTISPSIVSPFWETKKVIFNEGPG